MSLKIIHVIVESSKRLRAHFCIDIEHWWSYEWDDAIATTEGSFKRPIQNIKLIRLFNISGHRLQDLHWPSPYDDGSLRAGHDRDVERYEQSVGEPVAGDHAALVQHVARRLHGALLHATLRHSIRWGPFGECFLSLLSWFHRCRKTKAYKQ